MTEKATREGAPATNGFTPRYGTAGALPEVEEAIQQTRVKGEALALNFQRIVEEAVRDGERIAELEDLLAEARVERDVANGLEAEALTRVDALEAESLAAQRAAAADYERRLAAAKERLRDQAQRQLREIQGRLGSEADEARAAAERDLDGRTLRLEADLADRERDLLAGFAARDAELRAGVAKREQNVRDQIAAGVRKANETAEAHGTELEATRASLARAEARLAELADWLAGEAEAKVRRQAEESLVSHTAGLEAAAEAAARAEHERFERDRAKSRAAEIRAIRQAAGERAQAVAAETEAEVEATVARIRRDVIG